MKIFNIFFIFVITLIVSVFLCVTMFMKRIEVGEVGVRTQQYAFFGEKGVVDKAFGPGWHRNLPLIDSWNTFDATVQTTEFTTSEERESAQQRYKFLSFASSRSNYPVTGPERIELKSKDGYTVKLDVTVKYRIMPENAHELYQKFNTEARYKGIVRDQVQNILRKVFGSMRTEEFYNPMVRREKTEVAIGELREELNGLYVELVNILIRDISFDASYERKILDKKLADQDVELNKSLATSEEKKGETNIILAETEAMVRVIQQEQNAEQLRMKAETDRQIAEIAAKAELEAGRTKSDADLYANELIARGGLLERTASAEGEYLKAQALSGSGGANIVAMQAIEGLQLKSVTVSSLETDILNVEDMVIKLGGSGQE
ncbi:MAG: SPFH domain-containing protein [Opitutales bacterium]